jgi:hypothetical protein
MTIVRAAWQCQPTECQPAVRSRRGSALVYLPEKPPDAFQPRPGCEGIAACAKVASMRNFRTRRQLLDQRDGRVLAFTDSGARVGPVVGGVPEAA